jgi:hypothetical protein
MLKWFCDTFTGAAQEQPAVVLLRGRPLASWLLALGEHSGHGDLRGSRQLSCIMLKPVLPEPFLFLTPGKWCPPKPFIAQGRVVYNEPPRPDRWPRGRCTLHYRAQRLGVANDVFNGVVTAGLVACHPAFSHRYGVVSLHH